MMQSSMRFQSNLFRKRAMPVVGERGMQSLTATCRFLSSQTKQKHHKQRSLFAWYAEKLETQPLLTKGLTSGLIAASGDLTCQAISQPSDQKNDNWDWLRAGRFFLLGSVWVAPIIHIWYGALSTKLVPGSSKSWVTLIKRVTMDQFGFAPIFLTSFMSLLWTLEGDSMSQVCQKVQNNAPGLVVANWALWIPAMSINFSFVPLKYQVLFSNLISLGWNVYLSYVSASLQEHPKTVEPSEEASTHQEIQH